MPQEIFDELARLESVEAIVLGGSRAGQDYDEQSDYDVYVYLTEPFDQAVRQRIFEKHCSYIEYGNSFWELEDDGLLNNGIAIEFIYRNLDDFTGEIASVVRDFQVYNAYTTAMWYNLLNSKIIFDRNQRYEKLQKDFDLPYPKGLKEAIIERQQALLQTHMPAFPHQMKKALQRGDLVAVNHRTAEFLASYFELLFAVNELAHPGEKRMLTYAKRCCRLLPADFEEDMAALFNHIFDEQSTLIADKLVTELMALTLL
ncbi:nucleotidyltransferase domain-containing protein [Streptococcus dentiloxodontae]